MFLSAGTLVAVLESVAATTVAVAAAGAAAGAAAEGVFLRVTSLDGKVGGWVGRSSLCTSAALL